MGGLKPLGWCFVLNRLFLTLPVFYGLLLPNKFDVRRDFDDPLWIPVKREKDREWNFSDLQRFGLTYWYQAKPDIRLEDAEHNVWDVKNQSCKGEIHGNRYSKVVQQSKRLWLYST